MGLISNVLNGMLSKKSEAFLDQEQYEQLLAIGTYAIIFYFVMLFIFFFIAKVLWNNVGCKYITILKPVNSVFDIICISIFFSVMRIL